MKLPHPFFRLPVRFDVERLQAEVGQFIESEWQRHPTGFAGNSAVRLISVDGGENDDFAGPMAATPHLGRCPYIRQVLAHFGVPWSRSRLMRLTPSARVLPHSDIDYHWFHRVRVHIPVCTAAGVSFTCDGETVHMAAGEAWVFDNWRMHSVLNGSDRERIHLVADTTGNATFWRMVQAGEWSFAGEGRAPEAAFVAFDQGVEAQPLLERYNLGTIMHPAEVEQLSNDLLLDLERPRDENLRGPRDQLAQLIAEFCQEWRILWSLFADAPEGLSKYRQLRDSALQRLERLPPELLCASNRRPAPEVFRRRVLTYAVRALQAHGTGMLHTPPASTTAAARKSATKPLYIEKPVFIVAAPRSGSTLLFETLAQARGIHTFGGEAHALVEALPQLRPHTPGVDSNRLTAVHAGEAVRTHVLSELRGSLRDRDNHRPLEAPVRFLEKTPKNALRIPFFDAIFPDVRFVFLWRDPRENISSIMEAWRSGGWRTYPALPGWDGPWSMLVPPGYQALRGRPLEEVAAFQWSRTNQIILDDLERLPAERWMALSYAGFLADPVAATRRICAFAGVDFDERLQARLSQPLPLSAHTLTPPDPDKWRSNETQINRVLPALQPLLDRLVALEAAAAGPSEGAGADAAPKSAGAV